MQYALIGIAGGLLATYALTALMAALTRRTSGLTIPELFAGAISRQAPSERWPTQLGLALHFLYGSLQGMTFGLVMESTHLDEIRGLGAGSPWVWAGIIFGLLLWLVSLFVVLPLSGSGPKFLPRGFLLRWLGIHLVYGLALGLVFLLGAPGVPA